jgi:hypothetical protein
MKKIATPEYDIKEKLKCHATALATAAKGGEGGCSAIEHNYAVST